MSKFALTAALMVITGYAAYCLITYPTTDIHFIQAAYADGAIAVLLVFVDLIRLIVIGIRDTFEHIRVRRQARREARLNERAQVTPT